MRKTIAALFWALAILGVALAASLGAISQTSAETLLIILPVLAVVALGLNNRKPACGACP